MTACVLLVRHPLVARAWAGRCYGRSDMGWSRDGAVLARALVEQLAREPIDAVVHSGLRRTHRLADAVARRRGVPATADAAWCERDFGTWEGRSWHAIWRETGDLMDRMMTHPASFRPGGGETGAAMARRVRAAWDALPAHGTTLVVAHGGPIAAIRAAAAGAPATATARFIPACGAVIALPRAALSPNCAARSRSR